MLTTEKRMEIIFLSGREGSTQRDVAANLKSKVHLVNIRGKPSTPKN